MRSKEVILDEIKQQTFPKIEGWKAQLKKDLEDALKPKQNLVDAFLDRQVIYLDKSLSNQFKPTSQQELDKALDEIDKGSDQYFFDENRVILGLVEYGLKEEELRALKKSDLLKLNSIEFSAVMRLRGFEIEPHFLEPLSRNLSLQPEIEKLKNEAEKFIPSIVREIFQSHINSLLYGPFPVGMLYSQQLNGVPSAQSIDTAANPLDYGQSHIHGSSVYKSFKEGSDSPKYKPSDDKITIGYTHEGLPFQIVVDGFWGGNTLATFRFIDQHVSPLMNDFAKDLSESSKPEDTIQNCIRNIYNLRSKYRGNPEFTMSIAVTYKKNDELYCAGFGIGDTGLVLRKENGDIKQLTYTTTVDGVKDSFDSYCSSKKEKVIARNSTFNLPVNPGDEIFGYTYVFDELLTKVGEYQYEKEPVVDFALKTNSLKPDESLIIGVKSTNETIFNHRCTSAKESKMTGKFGDDCMMGSVLIPNSDLQLELQEKIYEQEKNRFNSLIRLYDVRGYKDIKKNGDSMANQIAKLEKLPNQQPELTQQLMIVNRALLNPTEKNINSLIACAKKNTDSSSISKGMSIAMILLGIGLAIIGGVALASGLAALPTGMLSLPGVAAIAVGSGLLTTSLGLIAGGIGFFGIGHIKNNNAVAMNGLETTLVKKI